MTEVGKAGIRGAVVVAAVIIVALTGWGTWREWSHRKAARSWELTRDTMTSELELIAASLERSSAMVGSLEAALSDLELARQTDQDRIANLEAQRDHLRAEVDRQAGRTREAEASLASLESDLESARQTLLELEGLPRQLQAELQSERSRITELEAQMDSQTGAQREYPPLLRLAGTSEDGKVFALEGNLPIDGPLPVPVYLCRQDTVLLEGWINRIEKDVIIGHVRRWRSPVSALVKGEKVFILPESSHEADH